MHKSKKQKVKKKYVRAFVTVVILFVKYLLRAIPVYKIAKTAKCKIAWLVWIPFFQSMICTFVLSQVSKKERFELFNGKMTIKDNSLFMLIYALLKVFSGSIINVVLILLVNVIPGIGQVMSVVTAVITFLLKLITGTIEYVYLRDTIGVYKPDVKKNQSHAFIITVLDYTITMGWARVVYLFTMMKLKPLAEDGEIVVDGTLIETTEPAAIEGNEIVEIEQAIAVEAIPENIVEEQQTAEE